MPGMEVARVALWKQRKVLAQYLWERGPMTADYHGQMGDQVARILNRNLERRTKFNRNDAVKLINEMHELGELSREGGGKDGMIKKITWLGGDPGLIEWEPVRETPVKESRVGLLEARVDQLEKQLAHLQQNITLSTREAVRELWREVREGKAL